MGYREALLGIVPDDTLGYIAGQGLFGMRMIRWGEAQAHRTQP